MSAPLDVLLGLAAVCGLIVLAMVGIAVVGWRRAGYYEGHIDGRDAGVSDMLKAMEEPDPRTWSPAAVADPCSDQVH